MVLSNQIKRQMQVEFNRAKLKDFQQKVVPVIQRELRVDSGEMRDRTIAVIEENEQKIPVIRVIVGEGLEYPIFVELKHGLFEDGSKLGARYDEFAKLAG